MKRLLLLIALLLAIGTVSHAAEPSPVNFTGQYELAKSSKSAFSLIIDQKGRAVTVSFSAANIDGSGAAPDADGTGSLNAKGEVSFQWSDSFENAGTATLTRSGKLFRLKMDATKVEEPRALAHYGNLVLKRASTKLPKDWDR